ncbi:hypothetical protein [Thiomicrospira sp.]|uniref:hypothetical protein n=1 Tax=Thiomicrospira sp. TaxID=935 RepID=UPI002F91CD06
MSIKLQLPKKEKVIKKTISFKQSENERVGKYFTYLEQQGYEVDQSNVLAQIVLQFISTDKGFVAYEKRHVQKEVAHADD